MLNKFPSDKLNSTKNALLFPLQAPNHRIIRFCFVFIKVYIYFFQQNVWTL